MTKIEKKKKVLQTTFHINLSSLASKYASLNSIPSPPSPPPPTFAPPNVCLYNIQIFLIFFFLTYE